MAKQSKELKSSKEEHVCKNCSKVFTARQNLHRHKKICNLDSLKLNCLNCHRSFSRKEHLVRHQRICKGSAHLTCIICGNIFLRLSNLKRHLGTCCQNNKYRCDVCNAVYPVILSFQRIAGCDSFQVIIFYPNTSKITAANRLCL